LRVQALVEAPADAKLPTACVNVSGLSRDVSGAAPSPASAAGPASYMYTLRLGLGVITSLASGEAGEEGTLLAGASTGTLWAVTLLRGKAGEGAGALQGLPVGVEELADEEDEEE
jgi:hypothetical protein